MRALEKFRSPAQRAFTLVEVMVAVLILGMVLASLYGTWRIILTSTDAALRITSRAQRARMATATVEQAFLSAMLSQNNIKLYSFIGGNNGNFSEVSFVAALGDSFPGGGIFGEERVRRVDFGIQPGQTGGNDLVLRQHSIFDLPEQASNPYPIVLAHDVTVFQLDYWDSRQRKFIDEWVGSHTNEMPQVVRLNMGFGSVGRFSQRPAEVVSRVIRIPSSAIPGNLQPGRGAPGGGLPPPGGPGGVPIPQPLPRGN